MVASVRLTNLLAGKSRAVRLVYLGKIQDTLPYRLLSPRQIPVLQFQNQV